MEQTESELLALRREKLAALEKLRVAPFGAAFETSGDIAHAREKYAEGAQAGVAGEVAPAVAGKMARLAGHRGALSPALPRSDHERSIARGFCQAFCDRSRDPPVS